MFGIGREHINIQVGKLATPNKLNLKLLNIKKLKNI